MPLVLPLVVIVIGLAEFIRIILEQASLPVIIVRYCRPSHAAEDGDGGTHCLVNTV